MTRICVNRNFWWLSPNQRKWWDSPNEWSTRLMDVLVENAKREDGWQSFMLEEPHFASWCLCYFYVIFSFHLQVMGFGVLFFMDCRHPNQKLVMQRCFLDFLYWCDAGFVRGSKEGASWRKEINTWQWGKLSNLVFWLKFFLQFGLFVLEAFRRNV